MELDTKEKEKEKKIESKLKILKALKLYVVYFDINIIYLGIVIRSNSSFFSDLEFRNVTIRTIYFQS